MGVLVEAGDERIRQHALSCGSAWFGDGARTEKEEERAKVGHKGLPYQVVKAGEWLRGTVELGHCRIACGDDKLGLQCG